MKLLPLAAAICLSIVISTSSMTLAANITQIDRYITVENKPSAAQINPLLAVQQVHFPQQIKTVGEALTYWLQYSGFALVSVKQLPDAVKEVLEQPLPQVVRNLGPLRVQDGLEVLVGQQVFSLVQDPLHRRVNFKFKTQYAQFANASNNASNSNSSNSSNGRKA